MAVVNVAVRLKIRYSVKRICRCDGTRWVDVTMWVEIDGSRRCTRSLFPATQALLRRMNTMFQPVGE